jgi:uncharacterized membrane protein
MQTRNPSRDVGIADQPIHPMLASSPLALFVAALFTDVTYWKTADPLWSTMSSWLLLAGLVMATVVILAVVIDVLSDLNLRPAWAPMLGNGLAVLLSVLNYVFHVRDGYSTVVPAGPLLAAAVVVILLLTSLLGRGLVLYRRTTRNGPP